MPTFIYKAITPQGQVVKSKMNDASKISCIKKLKRNGLVPISVTQTFTTNSKASKSLKKKNVKPQQEINKKLATAQVHAKSQESIIARLDKALMATEKITFRDIKVFSQNFYLLKKAQFNNIHALSTVIETTENPKFKAILEDVLSGVESGEFMYTTMEYYDDVFPYIYINMIKVGELSGSLENSLQQGVKYLEETDALNRKLRKILLPNILMFFGILIMLFVAVIVGVPMLQGIFDSIGSDEQLPPITIWFAGVVDQLIAHWYVPTAIIGVLIALIFTYISTPRGKYNFDYFKYTMPIFGKLIYLLDFSRLMKALLLNLQNGMRIQDSLEVSKNVVKNTVMLSMIETSINNIFVGQSWIEPFENARLSSPMATEMLRIGMQTDLAEMIDKLILYMEQDIDNTMEKQITRFIQCLYGVKRWILIQCIWILKIKQLKASDIPCLTL